MASPHNSKTFEQWLRKGKHAEAVKETGMFFLSDLDHKSMDETALTSDRVDALDLHIVSVQSDGWVSVWGKLRNHWKGDASARRFDVSTRPFTNGQHAAFGGQTMLRACQTLEIAQFLADHEADITWEDLLPARSLLDKLPWRREEMRFALVTGMVAIPASTKLELSSNNYTTSHSVESLVCGQALELRKRQ